MSLSQSVLCELRRKVVKLMNSFGIIYTPAVEKTCPICNKLFMIAAPESYVMNLQFFGGRGSGGGKNKGGGGGSALSKEETQLLNSTEVWESWREDPMMYQALADPNRKESMIAQLREDGYYPDEIAEQVEMANFFKTASETQTVSGVNTLYRGERPASMAEAQAKYKVGAEITTSQITSYSADKNVAESYGRYYGGNRPAVIIKNTNTVGDFVGTKTITNGRSLTADEVLVPKGMTSRVVATRLDAKTNTLYVTMENSAKPRKRKNR